ncbi:MAG TPA: GIY-YIG nuclease family protein [Verrucomicrobiae bacterium]|nr:GIY-YIG nuclease family protein [Verrucomicrobiae bacterium]
MPRPLIERLGDEFFKTAPREPGVYIMRGQADRVLYVGQSKNLRARLAFYKNANPDHVPPRLTRLVHQVETITLERCPTAVAARARELELLRLHQPKFNRADTGPRFHHYIDWKISDDRATINLHLDPPTHPHEQEGWHGPIRGRLLPCQALAALQRLSHCATHQLRCCNELPLLPTRLTSVTVAGAHVVPALAGFLKGGAIDLVTTLLKSQSPEVELPLRQLHECDAETLLSWARLLADV